MSEVNTNPFPGLRPFKFHEHELFFGREEQYEQMVGKLSEARFLAVVGTSGSGKSSLVRAGLLPALYGGLMMSAGSNWRIAVFRPKDDPIRELALALNHHRVFGSRFSENGSSLLKVGEVLDWKGLCSRLRNEAAKTQPSPSRRLFELLPSDVGQMIRETNGNGLEPTNKSHFISEFNKVLKRRDFYEANDFERVAIKGEAQILLGRGRDSLSDSEVQKLNRLVLEAYYSTEIAKKGEIQTKITEVTLRRGDLGLVEVVRQFKTAPGENLLIVVDQFEELFRYARISENGPHGNQAAAFVKLLLEARNQTTIPIYVVLTMRSDYLGDCAKFWDLPEAINEGEYLIPRLTREQRREAIRGPIKLRRAEISPQLVNQLLNDMGDSPDELPILQHALMRTWDKWSANHKEGEPIDISHYEAIGRMAHALSLHADEAYDSLTEESRRLTEKIFRCLTEKATGARETRRPASLREIRDVTGATSRQIAAVINVFRRPERSFVMPSARKPLRRGTSIDISHESLIRNWTRFRQWVNKEALSANIYRRLVETSRLHKQRLAGVLSGLEVEYALKWFETNRPNSVWASRYHPDLDVLQNDYAELTSEEGRKALDKEIFDDAMAFLQKSRKEHEKELRAQERMRRKEIRQTQMRRFATIISAALIVAVVALFFAIRQKRFALEESSRAEKANTVNAHLAYGAKMNLAQREFEEGNFAEVNRLLQDPNDILAQDPTLRGFEWYHLWRSSHNEVKTLVESNSRVLTLACPQNTNMLAATVTDDGSVQFHDLSQEKPLPILGTVSKHVSTAEFSPDGKRFAVGSQDGSLRVWDLGPDFRSTIAQRELVPQQMSNSLAIVSLAFSPDNKLLAAGTQGGTVTIWETNTFKEWTQAQSDNTGAASSVAFSPDSRSLAIGRNGILRLLDLNSGKTILTALLTEPASIKALAFSADGRTLAMGRADSLVTLWDLTEKKMLTTLVGHSMEVLTIALSKNDILATGSGDGSIRLWNLKTLSHDPTYRSELIETNASLKQRSNSISRSNLNASASVEASNIELQIRSEKSKELYVGTLNGHTGPVTSVVFSTDGGNLVSGSRDGTVKLWPTEMDSSLKPTVPVGWKSTDAISALAFSPDGKMLATGSSGGSVKIRNTDVKLSGEDTGKELQRPDSPPVFAVAFSPDGHILATGSWDKNITLWNADKRQC